jgi:hypothetical protein
MYHYTKLKDDIINWNHMAYPAGNRDIDKFEEANNGLISVNVYSECTQLESQTSDRIGAKSSETIKIHRRTKILNAKYHINILKIMGENGKFHYVYIKDYDRLVGSQTNKSPHKLYHCRYCQHGFKRQDLLEQHLENGCLAVTGQSVELPKEGETISFKGHYKTFKCPFVVYADFECITGKMEGGASSSNSNV